MRTWFDASHCNSRTRTNAHKQTPIHSFPNTWLLLAFYFIRFIFLFCSLLFLFHCILILILSLCRHSMHLHHSLLKLQRFLFCFEKEKFFFLYFHRRRCSSLFTSLCFKCFYSTRGIFNYDDRRLQHKIRTIYVVCVVVGCAVES